MSHKANISMNGTLYAWLAEVGRRMGARSVPGTARAILQAVMRAATSPDAATGMFSMIDSIRPHEDEPSDSDYIGKMMDELSDGLDPSQRININNRI